jgi:hypothetical protein
MLHSKNLADFHVSQAFTNYGSFPIHVPTQQDYDGEEVTNLPLPPHINKGMPCQDSQSNNYDNASQESAFGDMKHIYNTPIMPGTMPNYYMDYAEIHPEPSTVRIVAEGEGANNQKMSETDISSLTCTESTPR